MLENKYNDCPVHKGLTVFDGKWNSIVLFELIFKTPMRFGELRKALPSISNTMLASTLKSLEEQGLIVRQQFNEIPPHVEYSLSEKGKALIPIFDAIGEWDTKYSMNSTTY